MAMESPDVPVSLWYVGQVNVVVPHTPETGQDLSEGRHDQIFAVTEINIRLVLTPVFKIEMFGL